MSAFAPIVLDDGSICLVGHYLRFLRDTAKTDTEAALAQVAHELCLRDGVVERPLTESLRQEIFRAAEAKMVGIFMRGVPAKGNA